LYLSFKPKRMKKIFYLTVLIVFISCNQSTPTKADYMNRALLSDTYKIVQVNVKRVEDSLAKKKLTDSNAVMFEYNNIGGMEKSEAKTIAQVKDVMKDTTAFLKRVQISLADKMTKDHLDSLKN
jgi:hypothetical protein